MILIKTIARLVPERMRPYWRRTYAQEGEDIVLPAFFGYSGDGIYVDIGAHDPVAWSNTKKLAELGWWGLNVDPLPGTAARFHRMRPRDVCLEAAIDIGGDHTLKYWIFDVEPRWNCLAADEPINHRDGRTFRPSGHREVPVVTITEALDQAHLPRVDLVNLDIEGGEEHILRQWPWQRFRPKAICVEIIGKPAAEVAGCALTGFLADQGMVFASQLISSVIYLDHDFIVGRYPQAHEIMPAIAPEPLCAVP
jgi:FkbM family methyltransferase